MWINKKELLSLSEGIRTVLDGQLFDPRDNREGAFSILKNDIYTLTHSGQEQRKVLEEEKERLAEYLSDISHQLKTPISSILLMTELMTDAPEKTQQEFIRVSYLLEEALKSLEIILDIRNQTVRLKNDLSFCCDKKWTAEALINLLKNASECSGEHTEILIDCGQNPLFDWISVTDAGEGLKKEQIARLFRRFESSQKENGYGIGLPLALSIMRAQNGDIEVTPGGNGVGATFCMKFYR